MKVLVVVDYQNDFIIGPLKSDKAASLEQPICDKIEEYLKNKDMVVFLKDCHGSDYLETQEGKRLPVPHCIDEKGSDIYGKVKKYCNEENTVKKNRFGSFDLCDRLSFYSNIESIEFCGILGSMCVLVNAVIAKSYYPEVRIVVDANCISSIDDDINNKAMDIMENLQMDVINRSKV